MIIRSVEYAGTVAAVGERVTAWSVGDRVMGIEAGACYAELVVTQTRGLDHQSQLLFGAAILWPRGLFSRTSTS